MDQQRKNRQQFICPFTEAVDREWPSVAVIIPFYNGSPYIERAIQSVLNQTVRPSEFIVVNDGSREDESEMLRELKSRFNFDLIEKTNGGQGAARNAGVNASCSEFICFLDQDDMFLEHHIETLLRGLPSNDKRLGFVYADLYEADGDGNIVRNRMVSELGSHPKRNITDLLRHDMFVLPSASMISRTAFDAVNGFDPRLTGYEDDDLFLRIFRKGFTNYFVDESVTIWCIHTESTSYSVKMSRSRLLYFLKLVESFPDDKKKNRYYFRDCLVPRFSVHFRADLIKAVKERSVHIGELQKNLLEYRKAVMKNKYISYKYKIQLYILTIILVYCPPAFSRAVVNILSTLGLRRIYRHVA
jgi:glycosyltransferase involved in cell wall biosynthesis